MDRRVKERLIGASILVAIAVLVVPELLSGPKATGPAPLSLPAGAPEPTRTVTVDLATSKTSPAATANESSVPAAAPPSPSAAPSPSSSAAATPSSSVPASATSLENAAPSPKSNAATIAVLPATSPSTTATPPAPSGAQPASAAQHAWAVQLGSFASFANAEKLLGQLKTQGYSAYVSSSGAGTSMRYRVRVGPLSDREAASHTALKLKDAGHSATIVPPAP